MLLQAGGDGVSNVTCNASNANRADMSIHLSMNPQQPYDVIFYISAECKPAVKTRRAEILFP